MRFMSYIQAYVAKNIDYKVFMTQDLGRSNLVKVKVRDAIEVVDALLKELSYVQETQDEPQGEPEAFFENCYVSAPEESS